MTEAELISEQVARSAKEVDRWRTRANRALLALVGFVVLFLMMGGAIVYLFATEATKDAKLLRAANVESCERNNNVREAIRSQIRAQTRERRALSQAGLYEEFFPSIPPAQLNQLLAQQQQQDRETLKQLTPVDCQRAYPEP